MNQRVPSLQIPPLARLVLACAGCLFAFALCVGVVQAQGTPPDPGEAQICESELVPLQGAASRAVNSEPALTRSGRYAAFWSTSDPMGTNADRSVEIFVANTDLLGTTASGALVQLTESRGSILGGFNIMPDIVRGDVGNRTETYAVFASDRDLVPGSNRDGGFEIFLAQVEPKPPAGRGIWQLTNTNSGASILPSISDILPGNRVRVAFLSDARTVTGGVQQWPLPMTGETRENEGNYELYLMTVTLPPPTAGVVQMPVQQLTQTPANVTHDQPSLSPDGTVVVWMTDANVPLLPGKPAFTNADRNREVALARFPLTGTGPAQVSFRQVTNTGASIVNAQPDVSADRVETTGIFESVVSFTSSDSDLSNSAVNASTPSVYVAFDTPGAQPLGWQYQRISGAVRRSTNPSRAVTAKDPSIDSRGVRVVFAADGCDPEATSCAQEAGAYHVFVADRGNIENRTFSVAQVTPNTGGTFESPTVSGDGQRIALITSQAGAVTNPDLSGAEISFLVCPVPQVAPEKRITTLTGALNPAQPDVGDTVRFDVAMVNTSLTSLDGVIAVTDLLPPELTFLGAQPAANLPAGSSITNLAARTEVVNGQRRTVVTWNVVGLPKNTSAVVEIRARVDSRGSGTLVNQVRASTNAEQVRSGLISFTPEFDLDFLVTGVDLSTRLTTGAQAPRQGDTFALTVVATNAANAPSPASNVQVDLEFPFITLPNGTAANPLSFIGASATVGSYSQANSRWTIPLLNPGASATLTLQVQALAVAAGQPSFLVRVTDVQSDQFELVAANDHPANETPNGAQKRIQVVGTDMSIVSKLVTPLRPPTGARVTYLIEVRNSGPRERGAVYSSFTNAFTPPFVIVTDQLPPQLSHTGSGSNVPGATITVSGTPFQNQRVVWTLPGWSAGPAPATATRVLSVTAEVRGPAGLAVTNRVEGLRAAFDVAGITPMGDPLPGNDLPVTASATFTINSPAEASVTLATSSRDINEGDTITATVIYTDPDPLDTHLITLDWGDGTPPVTLPGPGPRDPGSGPDILVESVVFPPHTYADDKATGDDVYIITATVVDNNSLEGSASTDVRVRNVAPIAGDPEVTGHSLRNGDTYVVALGNTLSIRVPFTDPGFDRTPLSSERFFAGVDWGDGTVTPVAEVAASSGGPGVPSAGTVQVSHGYAASFDGDVVITITDDDDGGSVTVLISVVVSLRPDAVDDLITVAEDDKIGVELFANDIYDGDNFPIRITSFYTIETRGIVSNYDTTTGIVNYDATVPFFDTLRPGQTGTDFFRYSIVDDLGFTDTATATVTVLGTADAPELDLDSEADGADATAAFVEDMGNTILAPRTAIADVDSDQLSRAEVGFNGVPPDGTAERLLLTGSDGIVVTPEANGTILRLSGLASLEAYRTLLARVAYTNTSDNPTEALRIVQFSVWDESDESDALSNWASVTLTVTKTDDRPVITTTATPGSAEEGGAAVPADSGVLIVDVDTPVFEGGGLQIAVQGGDDAFDVLALVAGDGVTLTSTIVSYNGFAIGTLGGNGSLTLTVAFNGPDAATQATPEAAQAIARRVHYARLASAPTVPSRVIEFLVQSGPDEATRSIPATRTILITAVPDAPRLDLNGPGDGTGVQHTYTENQGALQLAPEATLVDPDSANILSVSVQITGGLVITQDLLTATAQPGITVVPFDSATGLLVLQGPASIGNFQTAVRSVSYLNNSDDPITGTRTIVFQPFDADAPPLAGLPAQALVNVVAVNDPPELNPPTGSITAEEGEGYVFVAPTLVATDVDSDHFGGGTLRVQLAMAQLRDDLNVGGGFTVNGSGQVISGTVVYATIPAGQLDNDNLNSDVTFTLTSAATPARTTQLLQAITYRRRNGPNVLGPRTITIRLAEADGASDTATRSLTITNFNDPPVVTAAPGITNEDEMLALGGGEPLVTVDDQDSGNAAVRMTIIATNGQIGYVAQGTTIQPPTNQLAPDVTLTGSIPNLQAMLAAGNRLFFVPTPDFSGTAVYTVTVNDQGNSGQGGAQESSASAQITVLPENDAPSIAINAIDNAVEDTLASLHGRITVADPDSTLVTIRLSLNPTTVGELRLSPGGTGVTLLPPTTGPTVEFQGNVGQLQAFLALENGIVFSPTLNYSGTATLNAQASDSLLIATDVETFAVAGRNDPPTLTLAAVPDIQEDTSLLVGDLIDVNDIDAGTGIVSMTVRVSTGGNIRVTPGSSGITAPAATTSAPSVNVLGTIAAVRALLDAADGVVFIPTQHFNGAVTLSVRLNDQGNGPTTPFSPQIRGATDEFTVTPVNDAPTVAIAATPALVVTEDQAQPVPLANRITIGDPDAGTGTLVVTATVLNGTLDAAPALGVTIASGDGTAQVVLNGTVAAFDSWNNMANRLVYLVGPNYSGPETLTVRVNDQGNTGGPAQTAEAALNFNIAAQEDPPTLPVNTGLAASHQITPTRNISETVTAATLAATDPDPDTAQIVYTVVAVPAVGVLRLNNTTLQPCSGGLPGATFTQNDIDEGRVRYVFSSGALPIDTSFTFRLQNFGTCGAAQFTYNIDITAAPPP